MELIRISANIRGMIQGKQGLLDMYENDPLPEITAEDAVLIAMLAQSINELTKIHQDLQPLIPSSTQM